MELPTWKSTSQNQNGRSSHPSSNLQLTREHIQMSDIPDGATFQPNQVNGIKQGLIKVFDSDGMLFAILNYENDKLNGTSEFYKEGVLYKSITYKNDIKEGWYMENGKEFFYKNDQVYSELRSSSLLDGYTEEIDIHTKNIIRCCIFDENHQPTAIGFYFVNNNIDRVVEFEEGNNLKVFSNSEMTEYDSNGNVIYKGGYLNDIKQGYPRNGEGKEYDEGSIVYSGSWVNNDREGDGRSIVDGRARYVGQWERNLPNGEGVLYGDNNEELCRGEWRDGKCFLSDSEWFDYEMNKKRSACFCFFRKKVKKAAVVTTTTPAPAPNKGFEEERLRKEEERRLKSVEKFVKDLKVIVRSESDWKSLSKDVTELVIDEGVCNELRGDVVIEGLDYLKRIVVKKNSMKNLNSLTVENNVRLESIVTEDGDYKDGAFYSYANSVIIRSLIDLIEIIGSSSINNIHYRIMVILFYNFTGSD